MNTPVRFFIFKIVLISQGLLRSHMSFKKGFFVFVKKCYCDSDENSLGLALGSVVISTALSLPVYEHVMSFHLFTSSLISFSVFCSFQCISL